MYNPCIRGWITYYSHFYKTQLRPTLKRIDAYVIRWVRRKFTHGEKAETFRVGDSCAVAAGEVHAEHVGPQGVAYIAGRRNIAA